MLKAEIMAQFDIVLSQMPYVGGDESRMSDFFMRFLGFMAVGRVLRRHGVPPAVIGTIELDSYTAQLMTVPQEERLAAGRQFMSAENREFVRAQAQLSCDKRYAADFVYDFVEPGPGDDFEFGINYRACGFCKFSARHDDGEILPHLCALDCAAYDARGIKLERTQTLAVAHRTATSASPATKVEALRPFIAAAWAGKEKLGLDDRGPEFWQHSSRRIHHVNYRTPNGRQRTRHARPRRDHQGPVHAPRRATT